MSLVYLPIAYLTILFLLAWWGVEVEHTCHCGDPKCKRRQ